MASTIEQIMLGLEARLATISGLRVSEITPDQINPPQAIVGVPAIPQYHATMAMGHFTLDLSVTLLVSVALDRVGQLRLAGYANPTGATSIRAAIETDKTLGGRVSDCYVKDFRPLGLEEVGLIGYYGGVFTLQTIATGV